jgi:hypothetical protein
MVVGAMIGIASVIAIAIPFVNTFNSREYPVPTHLSLHLKHGRYTVFEFTGNRSGFNFGTGSGNVTIDPSQVKVTAPDGEPVFVFRDASSETLNRGSTQYTGAVQFDARTSGNYDVRLATRRATAVVITLSVEDTIRSVLVWFGTGALGGILLVAGLVMLIVGLTRRGRARRATRVGWGQPSGQPAWGQPAWGQPAWGQPPWGAPPQYPPAPYYPPAYGPPQYPPPQQYPLPQYPPPQYPPPPRDPPPENPAPDSPNDPWAPPPP